MMGSILLMLLRGYAILSGLVGITLFFRWLAVTMAIVLWIIGISCFALFIGFLSWPETWKHDDIDSWP